ncbi:hypothetical protein DFH07DRAFT_711858, partial [Mycena maculata]
YAMSPMYEIRMEYLRDTENETSVFQRVTAFSSKKALEPRDIIDRGKNVKVPNLNPRFSLEPLFSMRVDRTVHEMQGILKRAASLIPGRSSCFTIDPYDTLMNVLRGAGDLDEMNVAWLGIAKRLELAHKYLDKYEAYFKINDEDKRPTSLVSTDPGIYDNF